jgi:hypothetical protein
MNERLLVFVPADGGPKLVMLAKGVMSEHLRSSGLLCESDWNSSGYALNWPADPGMWAWEGRCYANRDKPDTQATFSGRWARPVQTEWMTLLHLGRALKEKA